MNEKLDIHESIKNKLDKFIELKKIPNILFHGSSGSGKRSIVFDFIDKIYNYDKDIKKSYVLFVNCAHGKGIKFIREELKFFAKTHINCHNGNFFKSIILLNADKLTIDAQSALRRCIELFSHTTRFFIIVEDKYKLLRPILSRFSEIYIPLPIINGKITNLYEYHIKNNSIDSNTKNYIKNNISKINNTESLIVISDKLYMRGITGIDIINYVNNVFSDNIDKYRLLCVLQKVKKEFRNEKLIILFILDIILFRSEGDLENILSM